MNDETTVEIRRYPNRRFYDRSRRQYVTLQDIETLVLEGTNVEVRDSKTGEDLTRQVLAQILMERHPQKMDMFPVAMLHSILRANDLAVELWRGYMRQSLAAMQSLQHVATPFASPLSWMSAFFPPLAQGVATSAAGPEVTRESVTQRLEQLAGRIDRLEAGAGGTTGLAPADAEPIQRLEQRVEQLESPPAAPSRKPRNKTRDGVA
jgi:polyhydroxyalkanoate synthesis repressor PhaR